ncbi:MAG: IclR family transcriptional regulator [Hyphomicrobiales bacterium]
MSSENDGDGRDFVQSLARGLAVIEAFDHENPSLSLSDVARRTGFSRAASRRLLHTLVELGYAGFDGRNFFLKPKILNLGFSYLSSLGLWEIAQPLMEELVEAVHESCSASVLDEFEVVYVARVPTTKRVMSISLNVGTRLPAHATSMGRVLLAGLTSEQLDCFISNAPLQRFTAQTVTEPGMLRAIIDQVRRQKYAYVDEELELGLRSIAVPITDKTGKTVAALNLSTQANRTSRDEILNGMLPPLNACAARISQALGARR